MPVSDSGLAAQATARWAALSQHAGAQSQNDYCDNIFQIAIYQNVNDMNRSVRQFGKFSFGNLAILGDVVQGFPAYLKPSRELRMMTARTMAVMAA